MVAAMEMCHAEKSICIRVETKGDNPSLAFSGVDRDDAFSAAPLSLLEDSDILKWLNAQLIPDPKKGEFRVLLSPKSY